MNIFVRVNPRGQIARRYRCAMEFTGAWVEIDVDTATHAALEEDAYLEVSKTEPEGFERTLPADHASDASVTDVTGAPNSHGEHDANADLPQGDDDDNGGGDTGSDGDKSAAAEDKTAPLNGVERYDAIKTAIGQLDPANIDLWTANGSPKADALSAITGCPVSAADRDAAWAGVLAEQGN